MAKCLAKYHYTTTILLIYHLQINKTGPLWVLKNIMSTIVCGFLSLKINFRGFHLTNTHLSPATPCTMRLSLVSVPVLSKQHTSTLPANGILKGSVQYTPRETNERKPKLCKDNKTSPQEMPDSRGQHT